MGIAPFMIAAAALVAEPRASGDVVRVSVEHCSDADGEIGLRVVLSIRDGWHLPARASDHKSIFDPRPRAGTVSVVEARADGKEVPFSVWYLTEGIVKRGTTREYRAYEKSASIIFWVSYDSDPTEVSVRVELTATNGTRTLPESVVSATVKVK